MQELRDLAHDGRTVVVATHSMANLDTCDRLLVLAPGGKMAFYNLSAQELLQIMVTCACLAGMASAVRELVKERPIYIRERAAGSRYGGTHRETGCATWPLLSGWRWSSRYSPGSACAASAPVAGADLGRRKSTRAAHPGSHRVSLPGRPWRLHTETGCATSACWHCAGLTRVSSTKWPS